MTKTIFMQISLVIVVCVWDCDAARIHHTPTTLPQAVAGHTILGDFSDDISTYNVVKAIGTSPDSSTLDVSLFELNAPVTEKLSTSVTWRIRAHGSLYDESGCDSSFLVIVEKDSWEECTYDNKSIFVETHATLAPGSGGGKKAKYVVTEDGTVIPTDSNQLKSNLNKLRDESTNPATSRKFVGEDSKGPVRVRAEKAHGTDPNYKGPQDPLHDVDHIHIERRKNGTSGSWTDRRGGGRKEKIQRDWVF